MKAPAVIPLALAAVVLASAAPIDGQSGRVPASTDRATIAKLQARIAQLEKHIVDSEKDYTIVLAGCQPALSTSREPVPDAAQQVRENSRREADGRAQDALDRQR